MFFLLFIFEAESIYVGLVVLELDIWTRLASKPQISPCLCLKRSGIRWVCHYAWQDFFINLCMCAHMYSFAPCTCRCL